MSISRVAVVGAGIIGVALAREITNRLPAEVTVFDKAGHVGAHQSGRSSGIVDPALDAKPGTPEATLARRGVELLVRFVSERGIPYRECGQLLIAQTTDEADRLEELLRRAEANSIPGVRLLDRKEMREVEPNARGVLALYSPHTAVTDFAALTEALASDVTAAGGTFRFGTEVSGFDVMSNEVRVRMRTPVPEPDDSAAGGSGGYGDSDNSAGSSPDTASGPNADGDIDGQVHEAPRTYHGQDETGPVIDFRDELRARFGDQNWFKQVEDTIGSLSDRFSKPADGARPSRSRDDLGSECAREQTEPAKAPTDSAREQTESFDLVIVCAGLQADRLAVSAGFEDEPRIVAFASDHYVVDVPDGGGDAPDAGSDADVTPTDAHTPSAATEAPAEVVRGIVGTVPEPGSPFSERSVLRGVDDTLTLGPNTFVSLGRERYDKHGFDLGDMGSAAGFTGFWKFAAQTAKTAARGAKSAVSTSAFVEGIQKFVPAIDTSSVRPGARGIRAQAIDADGKLVDELRVTTRGRITMVRSLPRTGATSALAVAEHIAESILD